MRLTALDVCNFRGFESRRFQFHPQFNVLIGDNGTGKTSVLEAAAVAIGTWLLGFRGTDSRHIRPKDVRRITQTVEGRLRELPQYPVVVAAEGEFALARTGVPVSWSRSLRGEGGKTTQAGAAEIKSIASRLHRLTLDGGHPTLPIVRYFGAGRLWESVRETVKRRRSRRKLQMSEAGAEYVSLADASSPFYGYRLSVDKRSNPNDLIRWMAEERRIEIDEEAPSKALRLVYDAVQSMLPELESARYNIRAKSLILSYADGRRVPFEDMSDGYRNVIAMAADLAIKMTMLNPHFGRHALRRTPGVVLIDEIDLHLHPTWQRRITEDLRRTFPMVQFICTTHSPFIIQALRSGEELIVLDGQPTADVANMTLEEVAEGLMQVDEAEVSARYSAMKNTARAFLEELDASPAVAGAKLKRFQRRLAEETAPYADNPAYQAFLEMKLAGKAG
jgi:predicted ATP-binding protein involved in virulence